MASSRKPPKCCKPDCFHCPYADCRHGVAEPKDYSQYYEEHREQILAKRKLYYKKHRNEIIARQKANYDTEENTLKCRNWREKNLEKRRAYERERYLRRKEEKRIEQERKAAV